MLHCDRTKDAPKQARMQVAEDHFPPKEMVTPDQTQAPISGVPGHHAAVANRHKTLHPSIAPLATPQFRLRSYQGAGTATTLFSTSCRNSRALYPSSERIASVSSPRRGGLTRSAGRSPLARRGDATLLSARP